MAGSGLLQQAFRVVAQMVFNEGGDEEIAVVIALLHAQIQRVMTGYASLLQGAGFQLIGQEIIFRALVNQQRQFLRSVSDEQGGIISNPVVSIFTQVAA